MHIAPSTRQNQLGIARLAITYPGTTALWLSSPALMTWATLFDVPEAARWSILIALIAMMRTTSLIARAAVQRLTRIIEYFWTDVPLDENAPPLFDVNHRRRARRVRRSVETGEPLPPIREVRRPS